MTSADLEFLQSRLERFEQDAHSVLLQYGYSSADLDGNEWDRLQRALGRAEGAYDEGPRVKRAALALLRVRQIREAIVANDGWRAARYALELAVLEGDLLAHADHVEVILPIHRREAARSTNRQRAEAAAKTHAQWVGDAVELKRRHPSHSVLAIGQILARRYARSPETIRKVIARALTKNHRPAEKLVKR